MSLAHYFFIEVCLHSMALFYREFVMTVANQVKITTI